MAVSETLSLTNGSPLQLPIQAGNGSGVNDVAQKHFSISPSSTSPRLSSGEQANDPFIEKYEEARLLIGSNPEEARALFLNLIRDVPKDESHLLYLADYKIGLAWTYPEGSGERVQMALNAKQDLDQVYEKRNLCLCFEYQEKIILNHKSLRMSLQELKLLVPTDLHADIASKIEECTRYIPLLSDVYDKIGQGAQSHLTVDQAREIYHQALEMIVEHEEPEYLLARAFAMTSLALTYHSDNDNPFSSKALNQTLAAYRQRDELLNDHSKVTVWNLFSKLFNNLSRLFLKSSVCQITIKENLENCQREIALLEDPALANTPRKSRVTKEPVDPWKTARLFIAFGFATVVIAGAFFLGRRYISLSK